MIYHATVEIFPTAHSMESAEQNSSFTKHPSVLPTQRPNTILAAAKLNSRPVFIITDNPSITETKQTPQNFPKQYKNIKIKNQTANNLVNCLQIICIHQGAKRCNLCLAEKLAILQADQRTLLNKRSEFVSKCRHRNKFKLKKA